MSHVEILNGNHRFEAAKELELESLSAKIYVGLTEEEQMKMAADLNESQKPLNAGEKQKSLRAQMEIVYNRLTDEERLVINEEMVLHELGVFREGERKAHIRGAIISGLRNSTEYSDYISDAQTPATQIKNGSKLSILTAGNLEKFFQALCNNSPIGPWKPHESDKSKEDYEQEIANNADRRNDDSLSMNEFLILREEERKNTEMIFAILMEEVILPLMQTNQHEKAMTVCRYHVIQAVSAVVKEILLNNGSDRPSAPLFVKHDQINWEGVRTYVRKLLIVNWHDPLMSQIRIPENISDILWRSVFP